MKNKFIKLLSLLLLICVCYGCDKKDKYNNSDTNNTETTAEVLYEDDTYYKALTVDLEGEELLKKLATIIRYKAKTLSYDNDLYPAYQKTDTKSDGITIWDMYSIKTFTYQTCEDHGSNSLVPLNETYNREHMIAQSWFKGITTETYSDLFNVYPADRSLNSTRSNYPHGDVSGKSYLSNSNNCKLGTATLDSSVGTVFEVADEYKGDIARTYFYVTCRYYSKVGQYNSEAKKIFSSSFPYLTSFGLRQYLKWAKLDPVSEKEINRNNEVYKLQNNRNPFIDHEELLYKIWDIDYYNTHYANI